MNHPILDAAARTLKVTLECHGDLALLERPRRMLLVSRTERNPAPDTVWLQAILAATTQMAVAGEVLVTGTGRVPFDLALWRCKERNGAAIVVLEREPQNAPIDAALLSSQHLLVWPTSHGGTAAPLLRDLLCGHLADRAYAIALRAGGHMARVQSLLLDAGRHVAKWPQLTSARGTKAAVTVPSAVAAPAEWDFLTHFTREPDGQWPGETYAEYIAWLAATPPNKPRDAFAALCRILEQRRIIGCGRLMAENTPMVCFSAARPHELLSQRRWRKGLRRWSFTPYGIAIARDAAAQFGAKAVRYCGAEEMATAGDERCFMQLEKSEAGDWRAEAEWRVRGDVDLAGIPAEKLLAIVTSAAEADLLESRFGVRTIILGNVTPT